MNIGAIIRKLFLFLDGIIYTFICGFYNIFMFLANDLQIFSNEDYSSIVRRIYIILGVVMLFVLSYSLLRAVISPDEYSKGDKSFVNIIKNVIISLVIIAILPTVFDVATKVQGSILKYDVIGRIVLNEQVSGDAIANGGRTIATNIFRAFFTVNEDIYESDYASEAEEIEATVNMAFDEVNRGDSDFYIFAGEYNGYDFPELAADNVISYTFFISQVAGLFVLWCILLFCFDLGIRVIKMIYYQMIAPVAVICRVVPGNKAKSVFSNWVKYTISTYLEVFIRVLVMYLGVFLITIVVDKFPAIAAAGANSGLNFLQRLLVKAFIIMGIVAFIRQAPKLIQNVFGIETGGLNLGLKGLTSRLSEGGFYAAENFLRTTPKGMARRIRHAYNNFKETDGQKPGRRAMALGRGVISSFGGIGAGFSALSGGFNAKNGKEAQDAREKAIQNMTNKQEERDKYWAKKGGTLGGVIMGRASDAVHSFVGIDVASYDRKIEEANKIVKANDDVQAAAEKLKTKFISDASIVAQMGKNGFAFKGANADEVTKLYNEEYSGMSLASIKENIEQKREAFRKKDYEQAAADSINRASYTDAAAYKKAIDAKVSTLMKEDADKIANLDSMYAQIDKATTINIENLVKQKMDANGQITGDITDSVKASAVYEISQKLQSAEKIVNATTLEIKDPAEGKVYDSKAPIDGKSMDDIASAAKNMIFDLNTKKQEYIDKNGNEKK